MERLIARIKSIAEKEPKKIALRRSAIAVTYAELLLQIQVRANWLREKNVSRFGIFRENDLEWIIADLAGLAANCTVVPVPTFFSNQQLAHVIDQAELELILTDNPNRIFDAQIAIDQLEKYNSTSTALWLTAGRKEAMANPNDHHDSAAKITFTSGSTGSPKGVCLAAEALMATTQALAERLKPLACRRHLTLLPLSILLENIAGVYLPLWLGMEIVVLSSHQLGLSGSSGFNVQQLLSQIDRIKPDSMIFLPQHLTAIVAVADEDTFANCQAKFFAVGGGKVASDCIVKARAIGLPVYEGYGLSECCSVVSLNLPAQDQLGSVGKPLSHVEVRIVEQEIQVRSKHRIAYLGAIDSQIYTEDGWLRSGDKGELDENGFLYISGRLKNIIVSSFGRNISPEWLESELLADPLFLQVVIYGEARPYCVALVTVRNPQTSNQQIKLAIAIVNNRLPDYAQIKNFIVVEKPFAVEQGLITANGRPRREAIYQHYQKELDSLYCRRLG